MAGMAPGGLIVGGFVILKSGDRWTFHFDYRRILSGGVAVPQPVKGKFGIAPFATMVAAGPIASILSTLVCWLAFLKYGSGTSDWIGSFFWASAVGLLSLIPMSSGIHKSDTAVLWMLWTQPDQARAWMASIAVQTESAKGIRPREWDPEMVEQMLAVSPSGSGRIFRHLMAYYRCLDEKNEAAAMEHLETALAASALSGKAVRQALFMEAAEVNALLKHNSGHARIWRDRALKLRKPQTIACVDGALAMSEGRFDDALRDIVSARDFIVKRKLACGLSRFALQRLDGRQRICEESRSALSSDRAKASASA
jgi:hypothetical protein